MQKSQVHSEELQALYAEKFKEKSHLWMATVVFDMPDETLASGEIILDANRVHAQNIQCMICGMAWRRGREGRICSGTQSG